MNQMHQIELDSMNQMHRTELIKSLEFLLQNTTTFLVEHKEQAWARTLVRDLRPESQAVLARLVFLQGPWVRVCDIQRYLQKEDRLDTVVGELCRLEILQAPADEDDWYSVLYACSTWEVDRIGRVFNAKKASTKQLTIDRVLSIAQNQRTIFNSKQVEIGPHMRKIIQNSRRFLRVNAQVFRVCKRALLVGNLLLDFIQHDEDVDKKYVRNGVLYLSDAQKRGGSQIPRAYAPGFRLVVLQEDVAHEEQRFPEMSHTHFIALEASLEVHAFMRVLCTCQGPVDVVGKPTRTNLLQGDVMANLSKESGNWSVPLLVSVLMQTISNYGQIEDQYCRKFPHLIKHHSSVSILAEAVSDGVTWMESAREYEAACQVLHVLLGLTQDSIEICALHMHEKRAFWYRRLVTDLEHICKYDEAQRTVSLALSDQYLDQTEPELYALRWKKCLHESESIDRGSSFLLQADVVSVVAKPLGATGRGSGRTNKLKFMNRKEDTPDVCCNVETFALHHYEMEHGYRGVHGENFPFLELFRMFMWEVVLGGDHAEAFRADLLVYRHRALDWGCKLNYFYENRKDCIHNRLGEIRCMSRGEIAQCVWDKQVQATKSRSKRCSSQSSMRGLNIHQLQAMGFCLGGQGVANLCELMCRYNRELGRGGAPDLFLIRMQDQELLNDLFDKRVDDDTPVDFHHVNETNATFLFVEVKSENDRLSDRQICWMNLLRDAGLNSQVFKVIPNAQTSLRVSRGPPVHHKRIHVEC